MLPWWIAETALLATALALIVALAGRLLRWGPALRHAFWVLVLIKLVTPPVWHWHWSWEASLPPAPPRAPEIFAPPAAVPLALVEEPREIATAMEVEPAASMVPEPIATVSPPAEPVRPPEVIPAPPQGGSSIGWAEVWQIIQMGWLGGTLLVAAGFSIKMNRLRRRWRGSVAAPEWLDEQVEELSATLAVRAPAVRVVPSLATPLLWCLGRPVLLVPKDLLATVPAERWRAIVAHELAHLRRGDHWVSRLELVAGVLWWWFPVYWWTCRRLRAEADLACDAWVIWALPESRRDYAETLIDVCERFSLAPLPMPALGLGTRAGRSFERRLTMILHESVPRRASWLGLGLLGILAIGILPMWSIGQEPARPREAVPVPEQPPTAPLPVEPVLPAGPALEVAPQVAPVEPTATQGARPEAPDQDLAGLAQAGTGNLVVECQKDLRQIGLALHKYLDEHGHFPPIAMRSKDGKTPLLSWRVAILPYLEPSQKAIYDRFHLDEPWDSPHNRVLIEKIPSVYASPFAAEHSSMTYYQAIASPHSVFDPARIEGTPVSSITDGLSNSIMVLEAARAVVWTKPEDIAFDLVEESRKPGPFPPLNDWLGGIFDGNFNALFADGSVRFILKDIPARLLTALATASGGEVLDGNTLAEVGLGSPSTIQAMDNEIRAREAELNRIRQRRQTVLRYMEAALPPGQRQQSQQNGVVSLYPGAAQNQASLTPGTEPLHALPGQAPSGLLQGGPNPQQQSQQPQQGQARQGQNAFPQRGSQGQQQSSQSQEPPMREAHGRNLRDGQSSSAAVPRGPHRIQPGDTLHIGVLEALPGRPLEGHRLVRSDGTISLGYYGDLEVAGLTRTEAKVKLIERMRKFLKDEVLGLEEEDAETGKTRKVPPAESDRVFVDDAPTPQSSDGRQEERIRILEQNLQAMSRQAARTAQKYEAAKDDLGALLQLLDLAKQRKLAESRLRDVLNLSKRADQDPAAIAAKRRVERLNEQISALQEQLGLQPSRDDRSAPSKPGGDQEAPSSSAVPFD